MSDVFFDGKQPVGFQKTSLIDYPGRLASIIFFPFCNMRCPWCHNGDLILGRNREGGEGLTTLDEALSHIAKRRTVLGGVFQEGSRQLPRTSSLKFQALLPASGRRASMSASVKYG